MKALPAHPMLHPRTNALVFPIGFRKDGRPIWPAMGGDDTNPPAQPAPAPPNPAPQPAAPLFQAPPTPVPGPPPQYAQPAPQPPAPQPQPQHGAPAGQSDPDSFPANTPVAEMTRDQQLAYWKHQSRRHEQRWKERDDYDELKETAAKYQQLVAASQTEHERAVEEARRQGRAEAITETGTKLVDGWLRVAIGDRLPKDSVDALLAPLDRTKFLKNGDVDTDMVYAYASSVAPASPQHAQPAQQQGQEPAGQGTGQQPAQPAPAANRPAPPRGLDLGQGQPTTTPRNPLETGRERARARFSKTATAQ